MKIVYVYKYDMIYTLCSNEEKKADIEWGICAREAAKNKEWPIWQRNNNSSGKKISRVKFKVIAAGIECIITMYWLMKNYVGCTLFVHWMNKNDCH